ncbi:hypothetical protein [Pseudomonas cichorii]|uniref:hypothetical protein n=1 Tax=Pseudomonas cichorii TaxID=36746 RepID=UPI0011C43030|nr:hypothetical protein [Pseudomonas cichorii]
MPETAGPCQSFTLNYPDCVKTTALDHAALKAGSECSFTTRKVERDSDRSSPAFACLTFARYAFTQSESLFIWATRILFLPDSALPVGPRMAHAQQA